MCLFSIVYFTRQKFDFLFLISQFNAVGTNVFRSIKRNISKKKCVCSYRKKFYLLLITKNFFTVYELSDVKVIIEDVRVLNDLKSRECRHELTVNAGTKKFGDGG